MSYYRHEMGILNTQPRPHKRSRKGYQRTQVTSSTIAFAASETTPPSLSEIDNITSEIMPTEANYVDAGALSCECPHCGALHYEAEKTAEKNKRRFYLCCQDGKIRLPLLRKPPPILDSLFIYDRSELNNHFRQNIRTYNSMFAMTSFGANVKTDSNLSNGPYVFKINGVIHHLMGSLLPIHATAPKFAQLYIYDTENEIKNRTDIFRNTQIQSNLNSHIIEIIKQALDENNSLVKLFRKARDMYRTDNATPIKLRLIGRRPNDTNQYELPTTHEIGGLIVGDIGDYEAGRDVLIQTKDNLLQRINKLHPSYMALQYPLLFPYGEDSFTIGLLLQSNGNNVSSRKKVTMRAYYCYQMQIRRNLDTTLHRAGRLFQQYIVDCYTAVEEDRLNYIRKNQNTLRAEILSCVQDAVNRGDTDATTIGQRIILPSSHTGSPRYMMQHYQDAMAICRQYGTPDIFLTFTCNPKWPEIERVLINYPGQKIEERPDIVSRVFKIKLQQLLATIKSGSIFGPIVADLYVIEFQKRGLPHAHMLFWLTNENKIRDPSTVDRFVSAEIPDAVTEPLSFRIVTEHMIHGPCGLAKTNSPCMRNGICSKKFPKQFRAQTVIQENGIVLYRRRDNGYQISKQNIQLDNRSIVPYNKALCLKFHAHINVEICSQSMLIKYLFKYLTKGPDRIRAVLEKDSTSTTVDFVENEDIDEIKTYLNCRYLAPYEAIWRLFEYPIHHRNPAIQRLTVHLPNMQNIIFRSSATLDNIIRTPGIRRTTLTEWMETNKLNTDARRLTYSEFPTEWVWNQRDKIWTRRKQGFTLGRMYYINPRSGDLFYLRMLLHHIKGATTFEDLKTINNITYTTFQAACAAMGLLGDNNEWNETINEAAIWATSAQLRILFVTILLFCNPKDPQELLNNHWERMTDDILYKLQKIYKMPNLIIANAELHNYVLYEMEKLLNNSNSSLIAHNLPLPSASLLENLTNKLLLEELNYDKASLLEQNINLVASLNNNQLIVYEKILASLEKQEHGLFFIYGYGGTGKTYLWNTIITKIRSEGKIILAVASSGIASLLLPGGRTAHSRFRIPLATDRYSTCHIKKSTQLSELINKTTCILWDEAPMNTRYCFEALDRTMRDLKNNIDKPFGGITVILGGDFRQILPVIPGATKAEIIDATISNSYLWPSFEVLTLTENMRVTQHTTNISEQQLNKQELLDFCNWILSIGNGNISGIQDDDNEDATWIEIPLKYQLPVTNDPLKTMCDKIYPNFLQNYKDIIYLQERAILTPTNNSVDTINNYLVSQLNTCLYTYYSSDSIITNSGTNEDFDLIYPPEYLHTLNFPGIPPHQLELKVGLPIMLLRNLNQSIGLCNGTRLIITQLSTRVIEAEIINLSHIKDRVYIPRIEMTSNESKLPFTLKRRQFPVRICYAMTINKSQGQSLNEIGLYLEHEIFAHGQLYVALSRATKTSGLHVFIDKSIMKYPNYVKNIVYKEILQTVHTT